MKKIVFITDIPTHHKLPLLNLLSKRLKAQGIQFIVYFLRAGELRRNWHIDLSDVCFDYEILKSARIQMTYEWTFIIPYSLLVHLIKEQPSYIISGGFSLSTLFVTCFSLLKNTQYAVWSGDVSFVKSGKSTIRRVFRKLILNRATNVIAYGTKAAEYIYTLKPNAKVLIAYNTSDISYFANNTKRLRKHKAHLLKKHGFSKTWIHIVFIGGLIKRKGCVQLLMALSKLNYKNKKFMLHIVGDGVEKQSLKQLIKQVQLDQNVIFWGHKDKHELPLFFALGDIFVFPTLQDVWGLVLNEAMAAGLPVVASKYAGATYDLVVDGYNGFVIDPYKPDDILNKIIFLMCNKHIRERMGNRSQGKMLKDFSVEKSVQRFLEGIPL